MEKGFNNLCCMVAFGKHIIQEGVILVRDREGVQGAFPSKFWLKSQYSQTGDNRLNMRYRH